MNFLRNGIERSGGRSKCLYMTIKHTAIPWNFVLSLLSFTVLLLWDILVFSSLFLISCILSSLICFYYLE